MNPACSFYRHARSILFSAAVILLCAEVLRADDPPQFSTRVWQTEDGLPQNSVEAITQTRDGYIWVGTKDGLARFDGVRFTVFDEKLVPELQGRPISTLCEGSDGSLWIGCDNGGVTRFKEGKFTHYGQAEGLPGDIVRALIEGRDGSVWIGTSLGLVRHKDGKFSTFTVKDGLDSVTIRAFCLENDSALLIATASGLSRFENGKVTGVRKRNGESIRATKALCRDHAGTLWLGTDHGLLRWEGDNLVQFTTDDGLVDPRVRALWEDKDGTIWIGTSGGLNRLHDGKILPEDKSKEPFSDVIYCIYQDREENIWVGAKSGLHRLTRKKFSAITKQQGLAHTATVSVCPGRKGNMWIGTWGGGLNEWRDGRIFLYDSALGLPGDLVLAVFEDRAGSVWVSTDFIGGVSRWKTDTFTHVPKETGLTSVVAVIYQDHTGRVMVGDRLGLSVLSNRIWTRYNSTNGLAGDTVKALCEDRAGNLWIGTSNGLTRWRDEKFTSFNTHDGLSANSISALYQDQEGHLWVGTRGGGLNLLQNAASTLDNPNPADTLSSTNDTLVSFAAFTARQGLFNDNIYEILDDNVGYLWMTCPRGLFRVNKKALEDCAHGALDHLNCVSYSKADGLISTEFNSVAKPAGCKSADGRLWFPTAKGLVIVEPNIRVNELAPPVVVEEIFANGRAVVSDSLRGASNAPAVTRHASEVIVPPGRGELEIHYTALSFQAPEKNRFKYKLDGVDSDWMDVGTRRVAYYNNLTPGKYRFRVRACNNDGVWSDRGAALSVVLLPRFWQTWWFKFLGIGVFGAALTGVYRVRVARLREIERLRVRIAADLHDDLGSRLTKIAMITESAERDLTEQDAARPYLEHISATSREIIQGMDEIVWAINPKNDTLENLANYIFHFAEEFFHDSGVRCKLDVPAQLPAYHLSTEVRHNLFLAAKEAMNNVIKHAGATESRVRLSVSGSRLLITISDNGRGFMASQIDQFGNGLLNMRERLDRIGGKFNLQSQPGHGTTVNMEFDLKK